MLLEQRAFTFISTISFALAYVIVFKVAGYFLRKKALEKVKNQLAEDEHIVYDSKLKSIIFEIFIPLIIGGFIGHFMTPLFVYPEMRNVGLLHRFELPFWTIGMPLTTTFFLYILSTKQILTNKRVIFGWTFDFLYKFAEFEKKHLLSSNLTYFEDLKYVDIKKIEYHNFLGFEVLDIHNNENRINRIGAFKDLKKIKSILEEYSNNISDKDINK